MAFCIYKFQLSANSALLLSGKCVQLSGSLESMWCLFWIALVLHAGLAHQSLQSPTSPHAPKASKWARLPFWVGVVLSTLSPAPTSASSSYRSKTQKPQTQSQSQTNTGVDADVNWLFGRLHRTANCIDLCGNAALI